MKPISFFKNIFTKKETIEIGQSCAMCSRVLPENYRDKIAVTEKDRIKAEKKYKSSYELWVKLRLYTGDGYFFLHLCPDCQIDLFNLIKKYRENKKK